MTFQMHLYCISWRYFLSAGWRQKAFLSCIFRPRRTRGLLAWSCGKFGPWVRRRSSNGSGVRISWKQLLEDWGLKSQSWLATLCKLWHIYTILTRMQCMFLILLISCRYHIMRHCWQVNPASRPDFPDLFMRLSALAYHDVQDKSHNFSYDKRNTRYNV